MVWAAVGPELARAEGPPPIDASAVQRVEAALSGVIEQGAGAVVSITRRPEARSAPMIGPFGPRPQSDAAAWREHFGTGVLIHPEDRPDERYILTNRHVAAGALGGAEHLSDRAVLVALPGGLRATARIWAADPRSDLAVLQFERDRLEFDVSRLPALQLGSAEELGRGRLVVLLGNPYAVARDGAASAALGMISNLSRAPWAPVRRFAADQELTIQQLGALWHLDARVQLGASGGAVLDTQGRFVGLTTSLAALEGYESSVGYAIPFTAGLRRVVATLLDGYEVEYGFLGIAPRTSFDRAPRTPDGLPTTAAEVLHVAVDAPAAQAGLRVGDYVIGVNDAPVFTDDDLVREIGLLGPGAAARLEVLRGERRLTIEAPLGKWPVYDDTQIIAARSRYSPWRGLVIDWPTARRRFIPTELFERYVQAVVITEVVPDSPAARAGLQAGMFIASVEGRRTPTPTEFAAATRPFAEGEVRLVRDDGREITISAGP